MWPLHCVLGNTSIPMPSCRQQIGAHKDLFVFSSTRKHPPLGVVLLKNSCILPFPGLSKILIQEAWTQVVPLATLHIPLGEVLACLGDIRVLCMI